MAAYDYKEGKKRVIGILTSKTKIEEVDTIPNNENEFTYENGIRSWVGSVFVDIVDSTSLFKQQDEEKVARIMRAFCSEVVTILKSNPCYRQIGIRGDSVYAIYSAPLQTDLEGILSDAIMINTFQEMVQKILANNGFPTFEIGIGIGASKDLIIKAGKKGSGISDNIWIGSAVVNASKLSSEGSRNGMPPIVIDCICYENIYDKKANEEYTYEHYASKKYSEKLGEYVYCFDMINVAFSKWIDEGMKNG